MISKTHRQNHNFQILYFLAGSCHTADAAYALLLDLREDRERAVEAYHVQKIRDKAKRIKAEKLLAGSESDQFEGQADLLELENNDKSGLVLYQAAIDEIAFIDKCIDELQTKRVYAHLPDAEAHQAMQSEEWRLELIHRAENYILTTGSVPMDQFEVMRMHPDFISSIYPAITKLLENVKSLTALSPGWVEELMFSKPKLLEGK